MKNLFIDFEKFTPEELILATQLKNFLTDFNYREEETNPCYLYDLLWVVKNMIDELEGANGPTAERNAQIIKLRYFSGEKKVTYRKIGEIYNINHERVRQIVYKLFEMMRKSERIELLDKLIFQKRVLKNRINDLEKEIKKLKVELGQLEKGIWGHYFADFQLYDIGVLNLSSKTENALKRAGKLFLGDTIRAMKSKEPIKGLDSNSHAEVI